MDDYDIVYECEKLVDALKATGVDAYIESRKGKFSLIALSNGGLRIEYSAANPTWDDVIEFLRYAKTAFASK